MIRVFAVLSRPIRRYLQVKSIEDALCVVCMLHLYIRVQVVLDPQVLYEVLRLAQIPHLYIEVVSSCQQRGPRVLDKARTRN